jgi:hypothetical protein
MYLGLSGTGRPPPASISLSDIVGKWNVAVVAVTALDREAVVPCPDVMVDDEMVESLIVRERLYRGGEAVVTGLVLDVESPFLCRGLECSGETGLNLR